MTLGSRLAEVTLNRKLYSFSLDNINQGQLRGGCGQVLYTSDKYDRREY